MWCCASGQRRRVSDASAHQHQQHHRPPGAAQARELRRVWFSCGCSVIVLTSPSGVKGWQGSCQHSKRLHSRPTDTDTHACSVAAVASKWRVALSLLHVLYVPICLCSAVEAWGGWFLFGLFAAILVWEVRVQQHCTPARTLSVSIPTQGCCRKSGTGPSLAAPTNTQLGNKLSNRSSPSPQKTHTHKLRTHILNPNPPQLCALNLPPCRRCGTCLRPPTCPAGCCC